LGRDLGIPDELLKKHLMPKDAIPGDVIKTAMPAAESEQWFGRTPPDLSLATRERGTDWVYSYLLTFYLDPSKPTGVNNLVLPGASMPHVLGALQGWQVLEQEDAGHEGGHGGHGGPNLKLVQPGSLSPTDYKDFVGDLTNFMVYTAEPGRNARISLGWKVLAYVLLFWGLAYLLKKEFWKDVH
ncbi:MAG: cytochrome c1, partial [Hydrocarboniphaga effusa]|nr:cytochrome c1 [Hydrocarboniphaga effusa]